MGARLKVLFASLGARLLIPLFLTVAVVLAVHAFLSFRSTKEHFQKFVVGEADRSSGLIRRATHDGMLLNRLDEVQTMIERLAEGPDVEAIRVYDKRGAIVLSSNRAELGKRVDMRSAPCSSCHPASPSRKARLIALDVARSVDADIVRQLTVIEKEPACTASGCHDRVGKQRVLGVLDVEMSMQPLQAAVTSSRRQLVWTTFILMIVLGIVATIIVRRLVHRPIGRLQEGTRRIASGDLDTRIRVRGGAQELMNLAGDFNRMAEDLSRTQEELTDWSRKLEEKVVEKTAALQSAQRQVLHMEKMASLGKLSATVAHELNNPIAGMLTYARLVERELVEQPLQPEILEELVRYLQLVQRECTRCGEIVQNLLVFARRSSTEVASVDVNEVVERSVMLMRHHLEIKGIRLETAYLDGDSEIVADAGQLQQALVALLVNAVEAMKEGGALSVRLSATEQDVQIDVADTGCGMSPEILSQIFEPFFSTKQSDIGGVGLGLAVVYGIVHRHGGAIDVESEPGVGTTFHLKLPRRQQVHAGAQEMAPWQTAQPAS
ncbi:MAG TPA: ATP-binding protein [Longimicrobiales bacterium]